MEKSREKGKKREVINGDYQKQHLDVLCLATIGYNL